MNTSLALKEKQNSRRTRAIDVHFLADDEFPDIHEEEGYDAKDRAPRRSRQRSPISTGDTADLTVDCLEEESEDLEVNDCCMEDISNCQFEDDTEEGDITSPPAIRPGTQARRPSDGCQQSYMPSHYNANNANNIEIPDDMVSIGDSIAGTTITDHSIATRQIHNGIPDDESITTTHTMRTTQIGNRPARIPSTTRTYAARAPSRTISIESDRISMHSSSEASAAPAGPVRRSSLTHPMRMNIIDDFGHTMSADEMRDIWAAAGRCTECGLSATHTRKKFGPFGVFRRMEPITKEGEVYQGYCLRCHDVHDLRRLLGDKSIPLDLPRTDPTIDSAGGDNSLQSLNFNDTDLIRTRFKKTAITGLCSNWKFQLFLGIVILGLIGSVVGVGITFAEVDTFEAPPPTSMPSGAPSTSYPSAAPTTFDWNPISSVVMEGVESFGYNVEISHDGKVLAVSSPLASNSQGRLDVFYAKEVEDPEEHTNEWVQFGEPIVVGDAADDLCGSSMRISGDGLTYVVGCPGGGGGVGYAKVYSLVNNTVVQKGQTLEGLSPGGAYGHAVAVNQFGSRIFVSSPQHFDITDQITGLIQAFEFDGINWIQYGSDVMNNFGDFDIRFGWAIDTDDVGEHLAVGAPHDNTKFPESGRIFWYWDKPGDWEYLIRNQLEGSSGNQLIGAEAASHFGDTLALNVDGTSVVTCSSELALQGDVPNAGVVEMWTYDEFHLDASPVGEPLVGTDTDMKFGYDVDMSSSGEYVAASGENINGNAGLVRVYFYDERRWTDFGDALDGPPLGDGVWFGRGPSLALAAGFVTEGYQRMVIGYESIMVDGISRSEVRVFEYYAKGADANGGL